MRSSTYHKSFTKHVAGGSNSASSYWRASFVNDGELHARFMMFQNLRIRLSRILKRLAARPMHFVWSWWIVILFERFTHMGVFSSRGTSKACLVNSSRVLWHFRVFQWRTRCPSDNQVRWGVLLLCPSERIVRRQGGLAEYLLRPFAFIISGLS